MTPLGRGLKIIVLCAVALSGCGYSATRLLPARYRTIHIQAFENHIAIANDISDPSSFQTNLPGIEEKVTQEVMNRFLFDGNLHVTNKPEEADLILTGRLMEFLRQAVRRNDDGTPQEYRLNLVALMTLREKDGTAVFEEERVVGDATYFRTGSSARSETLAVTDLVTDFARRVVGRVIENW